MRESGQPRKVSVDQMEILGSNGEVIKEGHRPESVAHPFHFGGIKVFKGGLGLLILLPVLIPVMLLFFILISVFALFFGKGVVRVFTSQGRRSPFPWKN